MSIAELLGVWDPGAIIGAIVAGVGIGYVAIGGLVRAPESPGTASPWAAARMVGWFSIVVVGAFWIVEIVDSIASGDPLWWRVASRALLWILYSTAIAAGTAAAVIRDRTVRGRRARAAAIAQLKERTP